jgi:hypothetical protein
MTTMEICPNCGHKWLHTVWPAVGVPWKQCSQCDWDEKQELKNKIREQLANDPKCYD